MRIKLQCGWTIEPWMRATEIPQTKGYSVLVTTNVFALKKREIFLHHLPQISNCVVCLIFYNPSVMANSCLSPIVILCKIILMPNMSSNKNRKNVHAFQKSNADRNSRRHELYRLMPPEEKEILLARSRAKRAEMRKHNLLESSMNNDLATTSSANSTIISNRKHKNMHVFLKSNADTNARRRELYKLMPLEEKRILLARRRVKRVEIRKHNLSESSMNNDLPAASSSNSTIVSVAQSSNLIMRKSMLLLSEIGSTMPSKINYIKLKEVSNCHFCKAKTFEYEPPAFCCSNGSVQLTSHEIPIELKNLYLENTELSKHFRTYIRTYNNIFSFTSLGVTYDEELAKRNNGIYTFRVQGQMYHFINDLIPTDKKGKNLQLYFFDSENELQNRMACSNKLNEYVVRTLMEILKINPYSMFLKSLIDVPQLFDFYIALKCDSGLDQRIYNLPTVSEVAGIWVEQDITNSTPPHIRIYTKSDKSQLVNYYYGCYDPLQYPLLFPYGQGGWHCGIKKIKCSSRTST
ncbi:hypothetical protein H5410_059977 [Solanum commersonii]|uniref:Helitron helicase-like domain-containing protein n=1 Tax=Solanum commersonii TaxID=4109 RepID=A0A9J5W3U7_SOLCO|nr:hypothetical protein H5410_059977 [Solanum commersonii]